ncbi:site-2 protease family protein [bacterium]|nr:site-2 protease family protein [bacterium]
MTTILILFIVFFSIILHEFSHGYIAYLNGDDTAKNMGRLTFNPLPHIDPVNTILLPLMLIVLNSPIIIGMAKPVPVNPFNFRDYDRGMLNVGLAGPVSNIIFGSILAFSSRFLGYGFIKDVVLWAGQINFILAFFNLIPIPPLDGSRVVSFFLPQSVRYKYDQLERYGIIIVILFLLAGGHIWLFPLTKKIVYAIAGF